jgi:sec-independent protein translocase protein TatA
LVFKEKKMSLGLPEILIVLVIILLLFGPGRISKIAGEMGNSIRSFRDGLKATKRKPQKRMIRRTSQLLSTN